MENFNEQTAGTHEIVTDEEVKAVVKKLLIPRNDINLISTAEKIVDRWRESGYLLSYITVDEFETTLAEYKTIVQQRIATGAQRTPMSKRLGELDRIINKSLEYVKAYIAEEFEKANAVSHYGKFGIIRTSSGYKFPSDRQKKLEATKILINALTEHGFDTRKYGVAHWQPIYDEYTALLGTNVENTGNISKFIGDKEPLKQLVIDTLRSLTHLIRANYPNNYKAIYRNWGLQKESY